MTDQPGLRERKKQRTHAAISDAAIALFFERGFNEVSVAEIAEAAEVSKRTLFAYFPAKEDLVVHRLADHETEAARVVRARPAGTTPLAALRANFLDGLRRRDPVTGINDAPQVRALFRMILGTPALVARMQRFRNGAELSLAKALRETAGAPDLTARLASAQLVAVQWTLTLDNATRLADGEAADERYAGAVSDAEYAFALLANGLEGL
ncbi:TetR family transcriptional regulator [Actinomadura sp. DC4]|uniref:TetR family transcriptional regulator n=1 Tax=Actinomadura sp. DC4 TaxID=3055069 RepID=UPI0025B1D5E5|nr:TetR family transcriptional regulator [Actinomadura sp. DC4]MDN3352170.1 TetR family transcriptional regulator [Actinomadura sp. DC4]